MSEYLSFRMVKDLLAECPICSEKFDDDTRIPRIMPCCVQSICHPCLEACSRGLPTLSCPMCRHQHNLPGGVKSLPKEVIILRMLEHLKDMKLPCTDCPDDETASARCEDCGAYLCQECKRAHSRHVSSRLHKIISLDEMKDRTVEGLCRQHQCKDHNQPQQFYCKSCDKVICVGCTVMDHTEGKGHDIVTIDEAHSGKTESVYRTVKQLQVKHHYVPENIKMHTKRIEDMKASSNAAKQLIQSSFDKLIVELQHRRGEMLSELDKETNNHVRKEEAAMETDNTSLGRIASSLDYIKAVKSKADKIEDLQLMSTLGKTLKDMTTEKELKEETYERSGIIFVPLHLEYLSHIVQQTGFLRSATFHRSDDGTTLTLKPELFPEVQQYSQSLPEDGKLFTRREGNFDEMDCPHLEFDASTASETLSVSDGKVVSNTKPSVPVPDTRCRFKESANVLSSRPVVITKDKNLTFGMKIQFDLNSTVPNGYSVFEIALENPASDTEYISHESPILVMFETGYARGDYIDLSVFLGNSRIGNMSLTSNKPGVKCNLDLCFVFDGKANKFHLINEDTAKVIVSSTLNDDFLDKPLWLRVHIEDPSLLNLTAVLCSGRQYSISSGMRNTISNLLSF